MLTVAICTHDRPTHLRRAIAAVQAQEVLGGLSVEILVIDNTTAGEAGAQFGASRSGPLPIRFVHEPRVGLSNARNRALREAGGDVIAWLDDDARPRPGWLDAIARPFNDAEVAAVGGPVVLQRERDRLPSWFPGEMSSYYSAIDHGSASAPLAAPRSLVGANLAMRLESATKLGGFDPAFGHRGTHLGSGEETQLVERMRADGQVIWYAHDAVVDHVIDEDRWTRRWLLRRIAAHGEADGRSGKGAPSTVVCAGRLVVGEVGTQLRWLAQRRSPQQFLMLALGQRAFYLGALRAARHRRGGNP